MQPAVREDRPPYVQFETRAVEDRTVLLQEGHFGSRDVIFVVVTPQGTKDRFEQEADAWLLKCRQQVREGRLPEAWYEAYRRAFDAYKSGQELPVDGTPLHSWPPLSPAQLKMMLGLNIRTVEDLANASEEALMRIGMGARNLKALATSWLTSSREGAPIVQLEALKQRNASLEQQIADLTAKVALLQTAQQLQPGAGNTANAGIEVSDILPP